MTYERQQQIYSAIFSVLISMGTIPLPLNVGKLCSHLGIELCPLSQITAATGLTDNQVFQLWGNKDGVCMHYGDQRKIAYNNHRSRGRTRFTICEEICHFLLGHTLDPRFNMFDQRYDAHTYQRYEEEARMGAGLLLCQPQFFYRHMELLTPDALAYLCDISGCCAEVRCNVLTRFKGAITQNPLFYELPQPELKRHYEARQVG